MTNAQAGYAISQRNFVVTDSGLLRLNEVDRPMSILGMNEGVLQWKKINFPKIPVFPAKTIRATTNGNELFIHTHCRIPSMRGMLRASEIQQGDFIEVLNTAENGVALSNAFKGSRDGADKISPSLAYLLGLQYRLQFDNSSSTLWMNYFGHQEDAQLYADTLLEICRGTISNSSSRVELNDEGEFYHKILIINESLRRILENLISSEPVPKLIRTSNLENLEAYVSGWLDSHAYWKWGRIMFKSNAVESETRRILFNVLMFQGVSPIHTAFVLGKDGMNYLYVHLAYGDIQKLHLRNPRLIRPTKEVFTEESSDDFRRGFAKVVHVSEFARDQCCGLPNPDPEWRPLVELTPLQRHEYAIGD